MTLNMMTEVIHGINANIKSMILATMWIDARNELLSFHPRGAMSSTPFVILLSKEISHIDSIGLRKMPPCTGWGRINVCVMPA